MQVLPTMFLIADRVARVGVVSLQDLHIPPPTLPLHTFAETSAQKQFSSAVHAALVVDEQRAGGCGV